MELRVVRASAVSDFEWVFRIDIRDGYFQARLCAPGAATYPVEDWQPVLADAEAYRFYCEMYLDQLLGEAPAVAYRAASEIPRGEDLIDDGPSAESGG